MSTPATPHLAVLASFSGAGGVERMLVNLLHGFVAQGVRVDLLLIKARSELIAQLPPEVRVIHLGSRHTYLNVFALVRYLRRERPVALLAAKHRALLTAVWARRLAGVSTRVVGRIGTTLSGALEVKGRWQQASWHIPMRHFYPWADCIVAVSQGVADDVLAISGLPAAKVCVIRNPVITPELARLAQAPVNHPWLVPGQPPVILGIGRLTEQKDFPTLIRAYAQVRAQQTCRLIILGKGRQEAALKVLATALGVIQDIDFPGHTANPYAYLSRARLFVLSSAWEGSPNALTEALALGIPSVATDCPSGPREILQDGQYGALVRVGDVDALARAMLATLAHPLAPDTLRHAAAEYTRDASARGYLEVLLASGT